MATRRWAPTRRGRKDRVVDESWPTHGWPTVVYTREKAYLERASTLSGNAVRKSASCAFGRDFEKEAASRQRRIFAGRFMP